MIGDKYIKKEIEKIIEKGSVSKKATLFLRDRMGYFGSGFILTYEEIERLTLSVKPEKRKEWESYISFGLRLENGFKDLDRFLRELTGYRETLLRTLTEIRDFEILEECLNKLVNKDSDEFRQGLFDFSVPEFLLLMDIFQLLELELTTFLVFEVEAYCSEIQTMWVHTEIFCSLLMTPVLCLLIFHCIDLLMPVAEIETFLTLRRRQVAGVFELVPPPVGHGVQGHTCPIIKREALQSSDVNRCGEMAVSDSERCQVVGLSDDGVVPIYNSVTVYRDRHAVYIVS